MIPGFKLAVQSSDTSRRRMAFPLNEEEGDDNDKNVQRGASKFRRWFCRGVTRQPRLGPTWIVGTSFDWLSAGTGQVSRYEFIATTRLTPRNAAYLPFDSSSRSWIVTVIATEIKVFHLHIAQPAAITFWRYQRYRSSSLEFQQSI